MNPILMIASYAFALTGQLADTWTTEAGLNGGLKEANKIAIWLTSKIGVTGISILKCVGLAQALPVLVFELTGQNTTYFAAIAIPVGIIGFVAGIKNYLLLKKSNIKL